MTLPQGMTDTFLEAIKARLEALEESAGVPLFKRVWQAPFLDVKRFMQNPSYPAAIILDRGGSWNPHNGQVVTRRFAVGVIDCVARDHVGEASMKAVLNRGDIMADELMHGGDDEAAYQVMEVLDGDLEAVGDDEGPLIMLCKEYPCTAKLDRQALVVPPPTITFLAQLPAGEDGSPYSYQFAGTGTITAWSISAGDLPDGITLTTGGLLAGTPTEDGDFPITVRAVGPGGYAVHLFNLPIAEAP
jgi:hypothetical protein